MVAFGNDEIAAGLERSLNVSITHRQSRDPRSGERTIFRAGRHRL